jgi:DNA-binding Lrp family transcriptional regulator
MSLTLNSQKVEHYAKLADVKRQLSKGPQTWTQLRENLKMSKPTLSRCLKELMINGEIEKYSEVKIQKNKQKIEDCYRLLKRKKESIVAKIPEMFEETNNFYFPRTIKEGLDVEQQFVKWFYEDFQSLMHLAFRILDVRFGDLSPQKRIQYTNEWTASAMKLASENVRNTVEWLILKGQMSWQRIFFEYHRNPIPFFKALIRFEEIRREDKRKEINEELKQVRNGKIEFLDMKKGELSPKEFTLAQKREIRRLEKELEELS